MNKFIERQNIAHYIDQLKTKTDPTERKTLQELLAEEEAKQQSNNKEIKKLKDNNVASSKVATRYVCYLN
jgi:hypothetical protein